MNAVTIDVDPRELRGLELAVRASIRRQGDTWFVPSQFDSGREYQVSPDDVNPTCTCPDFEARRLPCKHVIAVRFVLFGPKAVAASPVLGLVAWMLHAVRVADHSDGKVTEALVAISDSQNELRKEVDRLASLMTRHTALLDEEYISIKRAAVITTLSECLIRQAVLSGDLSASNVSSDKRPVYRIAKADLAEWLVRRKCRDREFARPALRKLVERYFPELGSKTGKAK